MKDQNVIPTSTKEVSYFFEPLICVILLIIFQTVSYAQSNNEKSYEDYIPLLKKTIKADFKAMYREPGKALEYPFIVPGSAQYLDWLWDWDSWLTNIAIRQVLLENKNEKDKEEALKYERGCILNFLSYGGMDGWIPISIRRNAPDRNELRPQNIYSTNMHKPCLAQHAAFLVQQSDGEVEWLREKFYFMQTFVNNYWHHHRHRPTGLMFWQDDTAIGVDTDPATFYRPKRSSGSIYLNVLMYKELKAMEYLATQLKLDEVGAQYGNDAEVLKASIREHCWDERDGFYYSVDLNLEPIKDEQHFQSHSGFPRHYHCLIQRLGVWSGFMAMWAGIADQGQAERMVTEHYKNKQTFNAPYGIRTLSKMEKMYNLKGSGNPSSWQGPIWGISNYMVWKGLVDYGFLEEAEELAKKTVLLFGRDLDRYGGLHEYYQPENGEPILNKGFQNWNYLVLNMIAWLEERPYIREF